MNVAVTISDSPRWIVIISDTRVTSTQDIALADGPGRIALADGTGSIQQAGS